MLRLKEIIKHLNNDDFEFINKYFQKKKSGKQLVLFNCYRENKFSDEEVMEILDMDLNAYYTLKSRLYDKIQVHLITSLGSNRSELLDKVANITNVLYHTNKSLALAALKRLEEDLLHYDMPYALVEVYKALKKIHYYSPKYYEYSKLYNKHVAYTLALDKVEDLLLDFNRKLGNYYLCRDTNIIEQLTVIKNEINSTCRLYESHRLYVYQSLANISYFLFLPDIEITEQDEDIEDMLSNVNAIFGKYWEDIEYQNLKLVLKFLYFEYYHKLKLFKKEKQYFEIINEQILKLLLNNSCLFASKFLISKLRLYVRINKAKKLYNENRVIFANYKPDKEDVITYINYNKYLAVSAYYTKKYNKAIQILNELNKKVGLINYPHADIEIRLLLALFNYLLHNEDITVKQISNVIRKIKPAANEKDYNNVRIFIKILRVPIDLRTVNCRAKISRLINSFILANKRKYQILDFIKLDDEFIDRLMGIMPEKTPDNIN